MARLDDDTDADREAAAARATTVLSQFGLDLTAFEEPFSQANDVWLVDGVAVRISRQPGGAELFDEAWLGPRLPSDVGYPTLLGSGWVDGHAWVATERLPGVDLKTAWPDLTSADRRRAVAQAWERLELVHAADHVSGDLAGWRWRPSPLYALPIPTAVVQVDHLETIDALPARLAVDLRRVLATLDGALATEPAGPCHTDAHPGNIQWNSAADAGRGAVVGVLDFEFATIAPADLDLNALVGPAGANSLGAPVGVAPEDLAPELLARPGAAVRLHGYAVLWNLFALGAWCRHRAWSPVDVPGWRPRQDLEDLALQAAAAVERG
jgi:aminoglycoside phosphotransferase (APT) family kinase protein